MITSKDFSEKSVAYALSAIEIYNKPDFRQRSEVFIILLVNAWEALLKGKILFDNIEEIEALYISDGSGSFKTSRTGSPLTLELLGCAKKLKLPGILIDNISSLLEIRDKSIHFVHKESIDYLVFTLGSASLKNYHLLCKGWFGDSIDRYSFYILPMGFTYNFNTIKLIDVSKEPDVIQNLLKNISTKQNEPNPTAYQYICEVEVVLKSAKKITHDTDLTVSIDQEASTATAIIRDIDLVDKYPLTATELYKKVQRRIKSIRRNEFFKFLKDEGIRDNPKYSGYLFRNRRQKENYEKEGILPINISSLYNYDCLNFLLQELNVRQ